MLVRGPAGGFACCKNICGRALSEKLLKCAVTVNWGKIYSQEMLYKVKYPCENACDTISEPTREVAFCLVFTNLSLVEATRGLECWLGLSPSEEPCPVQDNEETPVSPVHVFTGGSRAVKQKGRSLLHQFLAAPVALEAGFLRGEA